MRMLSLPSCLLACTLCPVVLRAQPGYAEIPSEAYIQVETDPKDFTWPWRVFKSSPHTPPNLTITGNGGELAPGYIFMTPEGTSDSKTPSAEESGGFIVTTDNELVYALNDTGITDFRVEYYNGVPYLVCE